MTDTEITALARESARQECNKSTLPRPRKGGGGMKELLESIQKAVDMVWALEYSLNDIKDKMFFAPTGLSKAIGSLSEAQRQLKKTIHELNLE